MAHFSRNSFSLTPVILFFVALSSFCKQKYILTTAQLNLTMAKEFTCPSGAEWYACPSTPGSSKFVGCCAGTADPCSTGCAQGNIRPAAFPAANYGKYPDATCGTNSDFFTCASGDNTFWGCCKSVPCSTNPPTCPDGDLVPAFLDQPAQINFYAANNSLPDTAPSEGSGASKGAIIGGAVGGAIGVLIIGLIIFFLLRRRRRSRQTARGETVEAANPMMNGGKSFDPHSPNFTVQSPPPTYASTNGEYYQSMTPADKASPYTHSPYSQGQWAHTADGPQEMEADSGPSNRYSELPAEASRPGTHHRYSELSTGPSCRVSPHHSPKPSQTENTAESQPLGLGVVSEDSRT